MTETEYAIISDLAEVRILLDIVGRLRTVPGLARKEVFVAIDKWRDRLETKVQERRDAAGRGG